MRECLQKKAQELRDMLPTLKKDGRVLLLLDGLNELPSDLKRGEKTQEINDFSSKVIGGFGKEYLKVRCVLSCRVKEFTVGWNDFLVLGKIDGTRVVELLIFVLKDKNSNVRQYAAETLEKIGDAWTLPELERVVGKDRGTTGWSSKVSEATTIANMRIKVRQRQQGQNSTH